MKYTKEIVSRLSEDALYNILDKLYDEYGEDSEQYKLIDDEINKRVEQQRIISDGKKLRKAEEEKIRQELIKEFEDITDKNGKPCTMKAMVAEFGDIIKEDYYIGADNTVHSLCSAEKLEGVRSWEHEDEHEHEAAAKIDQLVYWRVYNEYFRAGPTVETLDRLRSRIVSIKKEATL